VTDAADTAASLLLRNVGQKDSALAYLRRVASSRRISVPEEVRAEVAALIADVEKDHQVRDSPEPAFVKAAKRQHVDARRLQAESLGRARAAKVALWNARDAAEAEARGNADARADLAQLDEAARVILIAMGRHDVAREIQVQGRERSGLDPTI